MSTRTLLRVFISIVALAGFSVSSSPRSAMAICLTPPGDITGDGTAAVTDVQCNILMNLWSLGGQVDDVPTCLKGQGSPAFIADHNCDKVVNISDTLLAVSFALKQLLAVELDANANQCVDACETDLDGDGDYDFTDCSPLYAGIFTGTPELCNGFDDNCNGLVDEPAAGSVKASCQNGNFCDGEETCKAYPTNLGVQFSEILVNPAAV
ncbi:MAG: putative metal-binding motif-containing protein, partial [Myxococcales bacterium]|nr:putative metal-binding motif-containing protein [Myxococcales bacterium]